MKHFEKFNIAVHTVDGSVTGLGINGKPTCISGTSDCDNYDLIPTQDST